MSRSLPKAWTVLVVVLALLVATATAFAQGGSATTTLSGRVTDSSGAVIPGADVTAKNERELDVSEPTQPATAAKFAYPTAARAGDARKSGRAAARP